MSERNQHASSENFALSISTQWYRGSLTKSFSSTDSVREDQTSGVETDRPEKQEVCRDSSFTDSRRYGLSTLPVRPSCPV
ncbi:hypothetical protein RRG08_003498 [Elysia crispata]|uniref:Uncharacterized protein n=1 Tax=Elysia crispata TaxID=231223 RepID=A0AAE1CTA2_9GAST|nr:hypothetical protein RRG08_003498 [Elysia crispata]